MASILQPCADGGIRCNSPAFTPYFGSTPLMRTTAETLPTWAIIVIAFGILLILILIGVILFCLCRFGCWWCARRDSCDDDDRKKKSGWYGRRNPDSAASKRPQILYRYPDDDAAAIVAGGGGTISASGSGYVPRALRLTNDRPKSVRVVEDVGFDDDGRPVYVVDGRKSSIIGGSTLSSTRMSSSRPRVVNEYVLRGADVDDGRSDLVYASRPRPAVITIDGQGISGYGNGADAAVHGAGYGYGQGGSVLGSSHSASIQVVGGHSAPWSAGPVPSIYPQM